MKVTNQVAFCTREDCNKKELHIKINDSDKESTKEEGCKECNKQVDFYYSCDICNY